MRWWWRIVVTIVLAPIVWLLAATYLGSATGSTVEALAMSSLANLPKMYFLYSLPAVVVVGLILFPADRLLALVGADIMIVVVAPVLAIAVPIVLSLFIHDPRFDAAALDGLAFTYGLVFGLSVREPAWTARETGVQETRS